MRQVLVEKSDNIGELAFNKTTLRAHEDIVLERGNNRLALPFKLKVVQGGELSFKHRIVRTLAAQAILLVAAFEESNGTLEAWVINMSGAPVTIKKGEDLIEISAYETVHVRQVEPGIGRTLIVQPERQKVAPAPAPEPPAPVKKPARKPRKKV